VPLPTAPPTTVELTTTVTLPPTSRPCITPPSVPHPSGTQRPCLPH
jgi:hypothetical protein